MTPHALRSHAYLLLGLKLIQQPSLRSFVYIPVLINIVVFGLLFFVSGYYFNLLTLWVGYFLPSWLLWLANLLWIFFVFVYFFLFVILFTLLTNTLGAPFYSSLSEKVQLAMTHKLPPTATISWQALVNDAPRTLRREWQKLSYSLPRSGMLLVLFFIPFMQLLASFLWFLFAAWICAIQYVDYPMDNQRIAFPEMLVLLRSKRWLILSFGIQVILCSMIPVVNLFIMPAAVAGGTVLCLDVFTRHETPTVIPADFNRNQPRHEE